MNRKVSGFTGPRLAAGVIGKVQRQQQIDMVAGSDNTCLVQQVTRGKGNQHAVLGDGVAGGSARCTQQLLSSKNFARLDRHKHLFADQGCCIGNRTLGRRVDWKILDREIRFRDHSAAFEQTRRHRQPLDGHLGWLDLNDLRIQVWRGIP